MPTFHEPFLLPHFIRLEKFPPNREDRIEINTKELHKIQTFRMITIARIEMSSRAVQSGQSQDSDDSDDCIRATKNDITMLP